MVKNKYILNINIYIYQIFGAHYNFYFRVKSHTGLLSTWVPEKNFFLPTSTDLRLSIT